MTGRSTEGLGHELYPRKDSHRLLKTGVWSGARTHLARTKVCDLEWVAGNWWKVAREADGSWSPVQTDSDLSPQVSGSVKHSNMETNLVVAWRQIGKWPWDEMWQSGGRGENESGMEVSKSPIDTSLRCHCPSCHTHWAWVLLYIKSLYPWPSTVYQEAL